MRVSFKIFGLIFIVLNIYCFGQNNNDVEYIQKLERLLSKPYKVYLIDQRKAQNVLNNIDIFFEKLIKSEKYSIIENKEQISYITEVEKNNPIFYIDERKNGITSDKSFLIMYTKEGLNRIFIKCIESLSTHKLPDDKLIHIAKSFILNNNFCLLSSDDVLGTPYVLTRRRHALRYDISEEEKYILKQRVIFPREFKGLNVINSWQIVDIHPETGEIISYKTYNWAPVNPSTGKTVKTKTIDEIMLELSKILENKTGKILSQFLDLNIAYYQSMDQLIPVLVITIKQTSTIIEYSGINEYVISLVYGFEIEQKFNKDLPKERKK